MSLHQISGHGCDLITIYTLIIKRRHYHVPVQLPIICTELYLKQTILQYIDDIYIDEM